MTNPFRVAVVGAGEYADTMIDILRAVDGVEVVTDAAGIDAGIDGVVVASPQDEQIHHARLAIRRRIPVLCRKPAGLLPSDLGCTLRLAEQLDKPRGAGGRRRALLAVGYEKPFLAEATCARERIGTVSHIAAEAIGRPRLPSWKAGEETAELAADLLSVFLPLLPDAVSVSATACRPGGEPARDLGENRLEAKISFPGDTLAELFVAPRGCGDRAGGMRASVLGSKGDVEIPIVGADDHPNAALTAQAWNWVEACQQREKLLSRPMDALRVHVLIAAIRASAGSGGDPVNVTHASI